MKNSFKSAFTLAAMFWMNHSNAQPKIIWANSEGGLNGTGTINSVLLSNDSPSVIYNYGIMTSWQGANPTGTLLEAQNGKLYGTTTNSFASCLFSYDRINQLYNRLFVFSGSPTTGIIPNYNLVQSNDGYIYGTTESGGTYNNGTLFRLDLIADTLIIIKSFAGSPNEGKAPNRITLTDNGLIYGTTSVGGSAGMGTIFKYDPADNSIQFVYSFPGTGVGTFPYGGVTFAPNGKCYGTTLSGGFNTRGILYEFDTASNSLSVKFNFTTSLGGDPKCGLLLSTNDKIYGFTQYGGDFNKGVIFEYDYNNSIYSKIYDFDGTNGANPDGEMTEASNGYIYGLTKKGGANDFGVVFKIDTASFTYTKIDEFDGTDGKYPLYAKPIEVDQSGMNISGSWQKLENIALLYPNPTAGILYIRTTENISGIQYYVSDLSGAIILSGNNLINGIDLTQLANGFYTISMKSTSFRFTEKILILK